MSRPQPRTTLFPYTTLFRSALANATTRSKNPGSTVTVVGLCGNERIRSLGRGTSVSQVAASRSSRRSEEHTSELQSQFHLVCRLLLEKKKQYTGKHKY